MAQPAAEPHNDVVPASFDSILASSRLALAGHGSSELARFEQRIIAIKDSVAMVPLIDSLAEVWKEHKQPAIAAQYYLIAGSLAKSEKKLTFAARLFLELARKSESPSVQSWEAGQAISGFNQALTLNPDNDSLKTDLAETYIGSGQTMNGVLLLRDVTTKNPDHVMANLMLGQQGIVSGQFDKAEGRFARVLKKEPKNIAAMLGLAEVYKATGAPDKAVAQLETAKKTMGNPEFSRDIDEYIKTIK
jgi:cytochrome c-type biogenesis protein CcmH/NrfG